MNFRVTDRFSNLTKTDRINRQQSQISVLEERLASGKRINRPSDDPTGAELVLKLRTSQKVIDQFKRTTTTANQQLSAVDDGLSRYSLILDRVKSLMTVGLSDTTTANGKAALAIELENLRDRVLTIANSSYGDEFVFGGTRQNAPPFDPTTGIPAATPTSTRYIQIEPGTNAIAVGVTADKVFSDSTGTLFADLTAAVAALRGTGNAVADKATLQNTFTRLQTFSGYVAIAVAQVGSNLNRTELARESLDSEILSLDQRANDIEGADFADTAVKLTSAQRSLEATLQVAARGSRSLFDFLG
jgi:flagellar hook-associated protein 3 FlgL